MIATRSLLLAGSILAIGTAASAATAADRYPVRPIRIVVPFTPGGGTDIIARALGQHLGGVFGQNVIIDNDIMSWYGVLTPARTPNDIIAGLAREIAAATKAKSIADALPDYQLIGNTPAEFAAFLRKDAEVSARIIAQSGAKAN